MPTPKKSSQPSPWYTHTNIRLLAGLMMMASAGVILYLGYFTMIQMAYAAASTIFVAGVLSAWQNRVQPTQQQVPSSLSKIQQLDLHDFESTANQILEHYYLSAYPHFAMPYHYQPARQKANPRDGHLERTKHGAMHAARVASYVWHFHVLHFKHDPSLKNKLDSLAKSLETDANTLILLTRYAALFHDSGRHAEGPDYWDKQSAQNCRSFLIKQGVPAFLAEVIGDCAEYKGDFKGFKASVEQRVKQQHHKAIDIQSLNYLRNLIADGDTLDIMRVGGEFRINYLNIYKKLASKSWHAYHDIVDMVKIAGLAIFGQSDADYQTVVTDKGKTVQVDGQDFIAIQKPSFNAKHKLKFEQAEKPYTAVRDDLAKHGILVSVDKHKKPLVFRGAVAPSVTASHEKRPRPKL